MRFENDFGGKEVVALLANKSKVYLHIADTCDQFCCVDMSKQECQQLIEQLMLICERLQE